MTTPAPRSLADIKRAVIANEPISDAEELILATQNARFNAKAEVLEAAGFGPGRGNGHAAEEESEPVQAPDSFEALGPERL